MKNLLLTVIIILTSFSLSAQEQKTPFVNGVDFVSEGGVKVTVYEDCLSFHYHSGVVDVFTFGESSYRIPNQMVIFSEQNTIIVVEFDDKNKPIKLIIPDERDRSYFEYEVIE